MKTVDLIMLTRNNFRLTTESIDAIYQHTHYPFNLIVVDNGSTDGTVEWLKSMSQTRKNLIPIFSKENTGFARGNNIGLKHSKSPYVCLINNDVVVSPGWLSGLVSCLENAHRKLNIKQVGAVGPISNFAGGRQGVKVGYQKFDQFLKAAEKVKKLYKQKWIEAGMLYFFCTLFKRKVLEEINFLDDNLFPPGPTMWEDNDVCYRARLKGWKFVIAQDVLVHHYGGSTFASEKVDSSATFFHFRHRFFSKFTTSGKKKLVAMMRIKNAEPYIERNLTALSKFVDEIIILDDGSTDRTVEICKKFSKVVKLETQRLPLSEARDRNKILHWAKERNPDWILAVDADDIYEDRVEDFQKLMNPKDPAVQAHIFDFFTFWRGETHYRDDGIWHNLRQGRLFKNLPNQEIISTHPQGFHCGAIPFIPPENTALSRLRVKHLGYSNFEECKRKYEWYSKLDTKKEPSQIGGKGDYSHLIDESKLSLKPWVPDDSLSVYILTKDSEKTIRKCLDSIQWLADEIIVVDTGSKDNTIKIIQEEYPEVNLSYSKWRNNFAEARNFALSLCTKKWILQLDSDEYLERKNYWGLTSLLQSDSIYAYLFNIFSLIEGGRNTVTQTYRLFRRIPEIYYHGSLHETIDHSLSQAENNGHKFICEIAPFQIYHTGYFSKKELGEKEELYKSLALTEIKRHRRNPWPYLTLGSYYLTRENFSLAEQHLKKGMALADKPGMHSATLTLLYLRLCKNYARIAMENLGRNSPARPFMEKILTFEHQLEQGDLKSPSAAGWSVQKKEL